MNAQIEKKADSQTADFGITKDYKEFVIQIEHKQQLNDGSWKIIRKEYMTVAGRLKMFWDDNITQGKQGNITTQKVVDNEKEVEFVATVIGARGTATGTAREQKSENVNIKSIVENCETSAVGRALGNLGYGLMGGVAPAEDVEKIFANQKKEDTVSEKKFFIKDQNTPITDNQKKLIEKYMTPPIDKIITMLLESINKTKISDLTKGEADKIIKHILSICTTTKNDDNNGHK